MAELLPPTRDDYLSDTPLFGNRWWCKIDRYGLVDLVLSLREKGESLREIANACNAELLGRPEGLKFFTITRQNVHVFVTQFTHARNGAMKRRFKDRHFDKYVKPTSLIDIARATTERIDAELDVVQEFRDSEGALRPEKSLQFHALLDRMTQQLKTTGELHKCLSTHVSSVMLQNAVLYFSSLLEGDAYLTAEERHRIYNYLAKSLLHEKIITQIEAEERGEA